VAPGDVTFETFERVEEFDSLAREWDTLVRAMKRPTPFLLHGWIRAWLRHCTRGAKTAIYVARRNGRLAAALPLVIHRRFGLRIARFVGDDHPFVDALLASDEGPELVSALASYAAPSFDCAALLTISRESALAQTCAEHLRLAPRVRAPALDLAPDFEQTYRDKYSSKKRKIHMRHRRQLAKLGKLEFELAKSPEELAPALEHAFRLHALRWRDRFDSSGFVTPTSASFHRDAARNLASDDVMRILTARVGGQPIAFAYYFVLSGRMFYYRTAFDPEFAAFSPGLLSLLAALELATGEGVTTVELLGGVQRFKMEIADRIEQLYVGVGFGNRIGGRSYARALAYSYRFRDRLASSSLAQRLYSGLRSFPTVERG